MGGRARKFLAREKDCCRQGGFPLRGLIMLMTSSSFLGDGGDPCVADSLALAKKFLTGQLQLYFWGRLKLELD